MDAFGIDIMDIALGVAIFYGLDYFSNEPPRNSEPVSGGPVPPDNDVEMRRYIDQVRRSSGGSPDTINRLKYHLATLGITPARTDPSDPVKTEAYLRWQIDQLSMKQMASGPDRVFDLGQKTKGSQIIDYLNLAHHREILREASQPDGE